MRDDFCVFILTHGRPDNVLTYRTMRRAGYTGRMFLVVDDEDESADDYLARYPGEVLRFCKAEVQKTFDDGDNFGHRRSVVYARNACWALAEQVGATLFLQLDDDYNMIHFTCNSDLVWDYIPIRSRMDSVLDALLEYYERAPIMTLSIGQGGDFIGGGRNLLAGIGTRRKAMNWFICSTRRPFQFVGRMNDDVNTYVMNTLRGRLSLTLMQLKLNQTQTQKASGGLTEMYREHGTYVKSFYTCLHAPGAVKVVEMGDPRSGVANYRLHHGINWHNVAPKILREEWSKGDPLDAWRCEEALVGKSFEGGDQ